MKPLSNRQLDSLRIDFQSLDDEIKELGAVIDRVKRPERFATDFDYHLLVMQKTAMENLRNVLGMRLVREYWKLWESPMNGKGSPQDKTMRTLVKAAKDGFRQMPKPRDGWGGTDGDTQMPPEPFQVEGDDAVPHGDFDDPEEQPTEEESKALDEAIAKCGLQKAVQKPNGKSPRNRHRTRNGKGGGGSEKWGVRPKHLAGNAEQKGGEQHPTQPMTMKGENGVTFKISVKQGNIVEERHTIPPSEECPAQRQGQDTGAEGAEVKGSDDGNGK